MRYCKLCNTGAIETEFHFLFHCPILSEVRNPFIKDFDEQLKDLPSDHEKLFLILKKDNIRKTGFILEKAMSLDNILKIKMIMIMMMIVNMV